MTFKVGDKVKLVGNLDNWIKGSKGVITEVRPPERKYRYKAYIYIKSTNRSFYYPLRYDEVESLLRKGEQLLFPFMDE